MRAEVRFAGTGGMGVVLSAVVLGHAAVIHGNLDAVQTQSYGSEARGTAAKAEVIISDQPIRYPKVLMADYSVLMAQTAFDENIAAAKRGSVVIIDPDLVRPGPYADSFELISVPAIRIADSIGTRVVSNMVMLGSLVKRMNILPLEAVRLGLKDLLPPKTVDVNIRALDAGADLI